ncbi:hypothetical protein LZ554_007821 [Drepanopeziza brunnea f. sp. 'monogermtubi']|nr:hypothetical protein LZ554_007821 [Drepanopeziza brunnea f. sp. 'monogermtubi']
MSVFSAARQDLSEFESSNPPEAPGKDGTLLLHNGWVLASPNITADGETAPAQPQLFVPMLHNFEKRVEPPLLAAVEYLPEYPTCLICLTPLTISN